MLCNHTINDNANFQKEKIKNTLPYCLIAEVKAWLHIEK